MIHVPWISTTVNEKSEKIEGDIAKGKILFTQRLCLSCHSVDGNTDSFGPDLNGIHRLFDSRELLEEIQKPDRSIQVGFEKHILVKEDNSSLIGRLIYSDSSSVTLLLADNQKTSIARNNIKSLKREPGSMMPAGLLNGLSQSEINNLLAYLQNLEK